MVGGIGHGGLRPWFRCSRNNRKNRVSQKKMEVTWNLGKAAITIVTLLCLSLHTLHYYPVVFARALVFEGNGYSHESAGILLF